jgi:hypothetical protein
MIPVTTLQELVDLVTSGGDTACKPRRPNYSSLVRAVRSP